MLIPQLRTAYQRDRATRGSGDVGGIVVAGWTRLSASTSDTLETTTTASIVPHHFRHSMDKLMSRSKSGSKCRLYHDRR